MDERFRKQVRDLFESQDGPALEDSAHTRIARHVATLPGQGARGRGLFVSWTVAAAAVAAAALLGYVVLTRNTPVATMTPQPSVDSTPAPARTTEQRRSCETFATPSAVFQDTADGSARLDLGRVALAVTAARTQVSSETLEPCSTSFSLTHGTLFIHARDLGGGELRVRTPSIDAVVRGTVFAVEQTGLGSTVTVVEGVVAVQRRDRTQNWTLGAGQVLGADGRVSSIASGRGQAILYVLGLTSGAPEPPVSERVRPSRDSTPARGTNSVPLPDLPTLEGQGQEGNDASHLLARADRYRKTGNLGAARELYERAGQQSDASAEAAWVSLARMELRARNFDGGRAALVQYGRRFAHPRFGPEALWIRVRLEEQAGDRAAAQRTATELLERWPEAPQAEGARQILEGQR